MDDAMLTQQDLTTITAQVTKHASTLLTSITGHIVVKVGDAIQVDRGRYEIEGTWKHVGSNHDGKKTWDGLFALRTERGVFVLAHFESMWLAAWVLREARRRADDIFAVFICLAYDVMKLINDTSMLDKHAGRAPRSSRQFQLHNVFTEPKVCIIIIPE